METKMKIIVLNKKESKLKYKIPTQKRLTQTKSSKKISANKNSLSKKRSKLSTDIDSISTRKTSDSLLNNKKNSITNINFVYKKNINRPKISIKVMKNPKINPNIKTENGRKTLAHSSSTGYLQTFLDNNYTNNESNKNSDIDNNYFNIVNNDNWIHSPKRNHYKLFTENIKDEEPSLNRNPKNKINKFNSN